ncbi:hypothetical protein [Alicyclobacillus sp. ALC3]|uniref:hypothetical protein n=1 Tax=Alicyclobacillus sp. ALC3 TaxID=2796143 RepID=UPI002379AE7D|nr:hypothetical protein [Alicyclobacillus sp. ALC3]WDL98849.1 hypothetical protein JC200_09445 [Alicyclobacillus sp. ALC3]
MQLQNIREAIDCIEHDIFLHSLFSKKPNVLFDLLQQISNLKEAFIRCRFIGEDVELLEDTRFRLLELGLNTEILLRELAGQNAREQVRQLEELNLTASTHM